MRDLQRSRVYAWEDAAVAPRGSSAVPYEKAQMLVDGVMHGAGQLASTNVDVDKLFSNRFVPEFNRFDRAAIEAKAKTVN